MDKSKIKDIKVYVLELPLKKQWKIFFYSPGRGNSNSRQFGCFFWYKSLLQPLK